MADESLEQAQDVRQRLVPDQQLYLDTNAFTMHEELLVPVTLFVGGGIITGRPVTFSTWFDRQAAAMSGESGGPGTVGCGVQRKRMEEAAAQLKALLFDQPDDYEFTDEERAVLAGTFASSIFLIDARVMVGNQFVPGTGTIDMKVRYASIDGWCYGTTSEGSSPGA